MNCNQKLSSRLEQTKVQNVCRYCVDALILFAGSPISIDDINDCYRAMDALERRGWPAAFVFAYDTAWRVVQSLFPLYEGEQQIEELK